MGSRPLLDTDTKMNKGGTTAVSRELSKQDLCFSGCATGYNKFVIMVILLLVRAKKSAVGIIVT